MIMGIIVYIDIDTEPWICSYRNSSIPPSRVREPQARPGRASILWCVEPLLNNCISDLWGCLTGTIPCLHVYNGLFIDTLTEKRNHRRLTSSRGSSFFHSLSRMSVSVEALNDEGHGGRRHG